MADAIWRTMIRELASDPGRAESLIPDPDTRSKLAMALMGGSVPMFKLGDCVFLFATKQDRTETLQGVWLALPQQLKDEYGGTGDTVLDALLDAMEAESEFSHESEWQKEVRQRSYDVGFTPKGQVGGIVRAYLYDHGWMACEGCTKWIDTHSEGNYELDPDGCYLCLECVAEAEANPDPVGSCYECGRSVYPDEDYLSIDLEPGETDQVVCSDCQDQGGQDG